MMMMMYLQPLIENLHFLCSSVQLIPVLDQQCSRDFPCIVQICHCFEIKMTSLSLGQFVLLLEVELTPRKNLQIQSTEYTSSELSPYHYNQMLLRLLFLPTQYWNRQCHRRPQTTFRNVNPKNQLFFGRTLTGKTEIVVLRSWRRKSETEKIQRLSFAMEIHIYLVK